MRQKAFLKPAVLRGSNSSSTADEAGESIKVGGDSSYYLQAIIDSLEDELTVIDRDYRILEVNEAVLSRYGKRRQEMVGQYCYAISHDLHEPCSPPDHECPVESVFETGQPAE